ncbi:hypothetical protein CHS0354_028289 [Potamilus streckersoni]|uniref:Peptidase S1 domain-containing protein n=1 Tax=Potamilus streckersoni TaxID=2493646 RepID=A0AAE0VIG0_9BIVA|nr:hypothetical protein CHS0354_028289 [Potamilus streckersoni]
MKLRLVFLEKYAVIEIGNSVKCGHPVIRPIESNFRVVGGREAIPHSWPWMVSLRLHETHTCGGTIIHPQWVLTAGHCFERNRVPSDWSVAAGKHLKTKSESSVQVLQFEKIIVHSGYNYITSDNDIALVKVNSSFTINSLVDFICPPTKPPTVGDTCFVTGWGFTEDTCCADVLKQAALPIMNNSLCNRQDFLYNQVTENMLCAGYLEGGHDACEVN